MLKHLSWIVPYNSRRGKAAKIHNTPVPYTYAPLIRTRSKYIAASAEKRRRPPRM